MKRPADKVKAIIVLADSFIFLALVILSSPSPPQGVLLQNSALSIQNPASAYYIRRSAYVSPETGIHSHIAQTMSVPRKTDLPQDPVVLPSIPVQTKTENKQEKDENEKQYSSKFLQC